MATLVKGKSGEDHPLSKQIPVILPERLLPYLFGTLQLQVPPESIGKYWETGCPWAHVSEGDHIPLGLYGDAAKYCNATGEKVIGFFINIPIWNPRSARMSRWLLLALDESTCLGDRTLRPLFRSIVKSLICCYDGLACSIDGNPRQLKFAVTELRGDWEWHCLALGLTRTWRNSLFCWRCDVSKQPGSLNQYLDFGDRPQWQNTELTHLQFLSNCVSHRNASALPQLLASIKC